MAIVRLDSGDMATSIRGSPQPDATPSGRSTRARCHRQALGARATVRRASPARSGRSVPARHRQARIPGTLGAVIAVGNGTITVGTEPVTLGGSAGAAADPADRGGPSASVPTMRA